MNQKMPESMNQDVESLLDQIASSERRSKRRTLIFTMLPFAAGCLLLFYAISKVASAQKSLAIIRNETSAAKKEVDSLGKLRDNIRLEYLKAKGFNFATKKSLLGESIKADELLGHLVEKGYVNPNLNITYYRKTLDQQKVWLALRDIGYRNIEEAQTTGSTLEKAETNTLAYSKGVKLEDVKIIALTLIRAGFRIQHIHPSRTHWNIADYLQIVSMTPKDGSPDPTTPLTSEQISKANSITDLVIP